MWQQLLLWDCFPLGTRYNISFRTNSMIYKLNMCLVGDIDILVYLMHCSRQYQSVNLSAMHRLQICMILIPCPAMTSKSILTMACLMGVHRKRFWVVTQFLSQQCNFSSNGGWNPAGSIAPHGRPLTGSFLVYGAVPHMRVLYLHAHCYFMCRLEVRCANGFWYRRGFEPQRFGQVMLTTDPS